MSQASSINTENNQGIRLPIDGLIEAVAERIGGDKKKEVVRFLKFGFVGTLGAILDLGVLNILLATVLPPTDAITGDIILINTIIATTISFTVAITSNFLWNRYWTYPDSRSRPLMKQLLLFAFICTVGWIGRSIWIAFATEPLKDFVIANSSFSIDLAGRLGASLATFFGIFVVMIWNFFVNRYWTFNDVD